MFDFKNDKTVLLCIRLRASTEMKRRGKIPRNHALRIVKCDVRNLFEEWQTDTSTMCGGLCLFQNQISGFMIADRFSRSLKAKTN